MKSYRELDIYNDSKKLAIEVHRLTLILPKFELYEEGSQKLYVNRGFGFIGYPGRVGILPEITVIELT